MSDKNYICPQCGPDPRGADQHAWYEHNLDGGLVGRPYVSDSTPKTEDLRHTIHMQMLGKSQNAKDCGELTVIPLGHAVTVAVQFIQAREERIRLETEIPFVQGMIDAKDQESDLDGRPVGEAYHIMCGNDREYLEYVVLPKLQSQLDKLQKGEK